MEPITNIATNEPKGIRKWMPLMVLSLALTIIILDTTILNVTLRTIINDLHTNIRSIQWVITAYSLMLAAFTITGGRLGDLFGRKKMFVLGAIIFAIGSFITSISPTVNIMILGEAIIEGIGAALMLPATSSLLLTTYQGRDRAFAFGIWGGIVAAAAALGPVAGGWFTAHYSWRWAFRINIFVVILLILGSYIIKETRDEEHKVSLDWGGVVLSSLGLFALVFGFIESSTYGWIRQAELFSVFGHVLNLGGLSVTPYFVLLGIIILALFFAWENHVTKMGRLPLVSLKLFRNRQFMTGASITAVLALSQSGMGFSVPVFLQAVKNLNPFQTGVAMLPMATFIMIGAPLSSYLTRFFTPKRIIQAALLIDAIGFMVLRHNLTVNVNVWWLAPGFATFGFGMGLLFGQINNLTLSAVPVTESGEASGVNNTLRQVGATLGAAIMGAILISTLTTNLVNGVKASTAIPDAAKSQISETVRTQASNIEFGSASSNPAIPQNLATEITNISREATASGNRTVLLYSTGIILLTFLLSFQLPNVMREEPAKKKSEVGMN
jgi:EmrB/QacA subfamily drug resistance transporter